MKLNVKFSESNMNVVTNFNEHDGKFDVDMGEIQLVKEYIGGIPYKAGDNISITEDGVISVLTASEVEVDNTKPVTSAAVATQVGNIEILLKTI